MRRMIGIMVLTSSVNIVSCLEQRDHPLPEVRKPADAFRSIAGAPRSRVDPLEANDHAEYLPKVLVTDVRSIPVTYSPGSIPNDMAGAQAKAFVEGKIRNRGDRTITEAQFMIYLLDARGQRIRQIPYRIGWKTPPFTILRSATDAFGVRPHSTMPWRAFLTEVPAAWLDSQGPEWQRGKAEVKMTDVKLTPPER